MGAKQLAFTRSGSGRPVVLLHGLAFRRGPWRKVSQLLAWHYDVIAFDLPATVSGTGSRAGVAALADAVQEACQALGLDRPHIVGNSFGGAVALELGVRGVAASITVVAPLGFGRPHTRAGLWSLAHTARLAARVPESVRSAVAGSRPARAVARRLLRGDHSATAARHIRFDGRSLSLDSPLVRVAPWVAGYRFVPRPIPCPVTILWGDRDRLLPHHDSRRAQRRVPQARMVTLLGCGHIPMSEAPHTVATEILHTCRAADADAVLHRPGSSAA